MNEIKWAALAAAGLLAAAPEAQATATSSASLTNFHYQLFDLDPGDGITPSVTVDSGASVSAQAYMGGTSCGNCQTQTGAIGSAMSVSASLGLSAASAQIAAGNPLGAGAGPNAVVNASTAGGNNSASANASLVSAGFILSPHTLLVFSGSPSGLNSTGSILGETANATARVTLGNQGGGDQYSSGQAYFYLYGDGSTNNYSPSTITASFINLTGSPISGYAYAEAAVSVTGAIPEPQSYALMLTGLLSLGVLIRRRRWR